VPRVLAETFHQRIGLKFGRARITLAVGAIEPRESFVDFSAIGISLSDLIGGVILMSGDEPFQCLVSDCSR
jgi:hypothetical protein